VPGRCRVARTCEATDKKRAARGCKRPKSREETPKEGNGSSRYRIAIIYTATHKNQYFGRRITCRFAWLRIALSFRKSTICLRSLPRCHKMTPEGQRIGQMGMQLHGKGSSCRQRRPPIGRAA